MKGPKSSMKDLTMAKLNSVVEKTIETIRKKPEDAGKLP